MLSVPYQAVSRPVVVAGLSLLFVPLSVLDFLLKFALIRALIGGNSCGEGVANAFRSLLLGTTILGGVFIAVIVLPTEIMALFVVLAWAAVLKQKFG